MNITLLALSVAIFFMPDLIKGIEPPADESEALGQAVSFIGLAIVGTYIAAAIAVESLINLSVLIASGLRRSLPSSVRKTRIIVCAVGLVLGLIDAIVIFV